MTGSQALCRSAVAFRQHSVEVGSTLRMHRSLAVIDLPSLLSLAALDKKERLWMF
jgi:hypothetical protein